MINSSIGIAYLFTFLWVTLQPSIAIAADSTAPEEVVVLGRQPGPPLWRVKNGPNTLYIFGVLHPLPAKFEWDPTAIEHTLTKTSVFIDKPGVSASTSNPFTIIGVMRKLGRLKKIQDDGELNDLLSMPLQQSLAELLAQYNIAYRKINRLRPLFAAEELQKRVSKAVGFSKDDRVVKHLRKLINKNDLPIVETEINVDLDTALAVLGKLPNEQQIDCLATTVQALRLDTAAALERAHAWIAGDTTSLEHLDYPDPEYSCGDPFRVITEAKEAMQRSENLWLDSAESVLQDHLNAIALLNIRDVIHPDGLLGRLAERGYEVSGK